MKILITGGAGYIGGFMVKALIEQGHEVVIIDNLSRGHNQAMLSQAKFESGDLLDFPFVSRIFFENRFDGVIHFAAYIAMGESMDNPYIYFQNNVQASLNLLEAMAASKTNNVIFSSTAGVYGNPITVPIPEDHVKNPENPYGESKFMVERILHWYAKTKNISYTALRYFNASGASLDGSMGEDHDPETHIIPNVIKSVLFQKPFKLLGTDYKTKDGTCVRDYIHVLDLVDAHLLALKHLFTNPGAYTYNVGTGIGYSNNEIIKIIEKVSGQRVLVESAPRRFGDADELIANVEKIKNELHFSPRYSDLQTIAETAWNWHKKNQK